ncbi:hypothetical protein Nepgr_007901 [Nepenthes gracilis]|uniref:Uncharacterized protein n=1 Tax=Nepenthes gracilis TaxID=150966 RepID=A0AAD3XIY5_NEPGR|nr:hypothetical protein Nepgr_007901 [Nepenthes gracilis]
MLVVLFLASSVASNGVLSAGVIPAVVSRADNGLVWLQVAPIAVAILAGYRVCECVVMVYSETWSGLMDFLHLRRALFRADLYCRL